MEKDANQLSELRFVLMEKQKIMDREQGEAFIDTVGFEKLIRTDTESSCNLFLIAEVNDRIVAFSRCEGNHLKRFAHKVEFGVCVLKEYWGYGIGTNFLKKSIAWADSNRIKKISLNVLEINNKAIKLYEKFGFIKEGNLINDKILSDGQYYNTVIMGRLKK